MHFIRNSRLARRTAASLAALVMAGSFGVAAAQAAPAIDRNQPAPTPNADPDPFYTPPVAIPAGAPGDVLRARPAKAGPPTARSLANATQMMYLTTDAMGERTVATGVVLVPKGVDISTAPVVGFAPGTTGPAFRCTVSRFINSGAFYEQAAVNGMLAKGWVVVVTDYEGYHENPTTSYIVGQAMGPALIDAVRAASRLPETGVPASPKVAFRGYSQGGGAVMAAGERIASYAPEMNLVGIAGGGVPANLSVVATGLEGRPTFGFLLNALIGLDNAYPDLQLDNYLLPLGKTTLDAMNADDCTLELLLDYAGDSVGDYTTDVPFLEPAWLDRVAQNKLGSVKINVPVFQYHATEDDIVAYSQAQTLRTKYCGLGMNLTWKTYDVGHVTGVGRGNPDALAYLADRFAGKPVTSNC